MATPISSVVYEAYPKVPMDGFISELAFEFPDVPEEAFPHYILRAVNRLARDGNVLRRTAYVKTQPFVERYPIEPPDCMDIVAIMDVALGRGGAVTRLTGAPTVMPCGVTVWYEEPNMLVVSPVRANDEFRITVSVAPTYEACNLDKILLTEYYDTVIEGVRYFLYSLNDKPWSSATRAQDCEMRFLRMVRAAAVQTMTGRQRGAIKARRPRAM